MGELHPKSARRGVSGPCRLAVGLVLTACSLPVALAQTTVSNTTYSSGQSAIVADSVSVTTSGSVVIANGASAVFVANQGVTLTAGFTVESGGQFTADFNVSAYADPQAPTVPANLIASATTYTGFDLSWDPSSDNVGVSGYEVLRDATTLGPFANPPTVLTGLSPGTSYTMKVRARDAWGNWSGWSDPLVVATLENVPPSQPAGLAASYVSGEGFYLSWAASTDNVAVTHYEVALVNGTNYSVQGGTATSGFFLTGLAPSSQYFVAVRAVDAAGNLSVWSGDLPVTTVANTGADTAPANGIPDVLEAANAWNLSGSTEQASTAVELNVTEPTP